MKSKLISTHTAHAGAALVRIGAGLGAYVVAVAASAALALSPTSVSLPVNATTTVSISGARGSIQAASTNTAIVKIQLSNVTRSSATLTIRGVATGSASVNVHDSETSKALPVAVTSAMTVSPTSVSLSAGATAAITASNASGALAATSSNTSVASVSVSGNVATVLGVSAGSTTVAVKDTYTTVNVPVTVIGSGTTGNARYSVIAWNDLGMHCMDGKDYSVFSILPPYNNLHAQLVNATTGKAVTTGVSLTYEAVSDPSGSINTSSSGKTNFWAWATTIYGATLAPDVGLTGNATPSLSAKPMTLNTANNWFEATGLPITPYADNIVNGSFAKNYYPTVKVTARDMSGKILASTTAVLPVSDEITCIGCHASRPASETNPALIAAKPAGGWVGNADAEKDWKQNILKLHDEKQSTSGTSAAGPYKAAYQSALNAVGRPTGLFDSAANRALPTLCAACHASNALPGSGVAGVSALTSAQHSTHGAVVDPATATTLDASTNRGACYNCHPGSITACLRGAMSTVSAIQCQSCHGNMTKVGNVARVGWLDQPNCQACHNAGNRAVSALDAGGNLIVPSDTRFATNPDTPKVAALPTKHFSLFRFSAGHGGLQCESCHGATHAEYPSTHLNDNLQSIAMQGYAGTLRECTVCHASLPVSVNGGPHGMHTVGASWVSGHGDAVERSGGTAQCAYCHGSDFRGSPLAQVKVAKSFQVEGTARSYTPGQNVGCYDCHNGPHP